MTETIGRPGRAPRLHEQIERLLTEEIYAGRFTEGDHLTEQSVAERFGVSRGPVRNAFRRLEGDGLLSRNARGMTVAAIGSRSWPKIAFGEQELSRPLVEATASWEAIYHEVAEAAVMHAAYGDWRIVETELARYFGVSRTVAREVLARLEHRGILRKDPGHRWHLPKLDETRVVNLYEMRKLLEPEALVQAAEKAPRAFLDEMRGGLLAALEHQELLPATEFDRLERQLHVDLLSYARNDLLRETLHHFHALLFTNVNVYRATRSKFGQDPFPGEHLEIIDRLLDKDLQSARRKMSEHMGISIERALDRLAYMNECVPLEQKPYLAPSN
ncbi:GntR family transcriptional regulator [Chelativorans sp. YIM 93263]|uniref:GntR family transcriptional regulator n=1 Tax=Chelativorans sp. YIM 93263 TaxID=2906648 RepID=UPI00237812D8|nr:GntR family transcriptional regulator [Chelativorans sp. YIM 93263]